MTVGLRESRVHKSTTEGLGRPRHLGVSVSGALSGRTDETRREDRLERCYRTVVPEDVRGITDAA